MLAHCLLSLLIWVPIVGGLVCLVAGRHGGSSEATRWIAMVFALATLALCIPLYHLFDSSSYHMQFVENYAWIPSLGIRYALGVDGISVLFIILTSFTTLIVILAAWRVIQEKVGQYMAVFLISTGILNGSFAATNAILFYFFWEASMIPMYLGIGIWGGPKRAYAAMKFFMFTFGGSVFLLLAFLYLGFQAGSFDIQHFQSLHLSATEETWVFMAFLIAFAVKVPMWPVHTWLPDAHTQAPAGGSVVLAALMLKMGAYGFIRFSMPIVPGVHQAADWFLIILALIAIVYVGLASIAQTDMKRLIAYSSVSHMGIVMLGIFMVFMIVGQTHGHTASNQMIATVSVQGAIFQMISHAFSSGGLFLGVSYLRLRLGSLFIKDYQGMATSMPVFAAFLMLFAMANVGLPGTTGFVGEFMVVVAAFKANIWIASLASLTLVLAPAYTLWMLKRVIFGEFTNDRMAAAKDLSAREIVVFILLGVPIIVFGVWPEPILQISHAAAAHFVQHTVAAIPAGTY